MLLKAVKYLVFDVSNKMFPFLIAPLVSNTLGVEQFGVYSTSLIIYSLLIVMVGWGANSYTLVKLSKENNENNTINNDSTSLIIRNFIVLSIVSFIVAMFDFEQALNYMSILFSASIYCLLQIKLSNYQYLGKVYSFGLTNITLSVTQLLSILFSIYIVGNINYVWAINALLYMLHMTICSYWPSLTLVSNNKLINISKFCISQLPHLLSNWIKLGIDRIVLSIYLTSYDVGIYSIALQFGMVLSVINQSLNRAWTPFVFSKLKDAEGYNYIRNILLISTVPLSLGCLVYLCSGFIIEIMFPNIVDYNNSILGCVILAYVFHGMYLLNSNYLYYYESTLLLSKASMFSTILHSLLSFLLIPYYGIFGAAIALGTGWCSQFIILMILLYRRRTWAK